MSVIRCHGSRSSIDVCDDLMFISILDLMLLDLMPLGQDEGNTTFIAATFLKLQVPNLSHFVKEEFLRGKGEGVTIK